MWVLITLAATCAANTPVKVTHNTPLLPAPYCPQHSHAVSVHQVNNTHYECVCDIGYITADPAQFCQYDQSSKMVAFILAIIPVTSVLGIHWFYLARRAAGYILLGIVRMLFPVIMTCFGFCLHGIFRHFDQELLAYITQFLMVVWYIADWALILDNVVPDGNGYALELDM